MSSPDIYEVLFSAMTAEKVSLFDKPHHCIKRGRLNRFTATNRVCQEEMQIGCQRARFSVVKTFLKADFKRLTRVCRYGYQTSEFMRSSLKRNDREMLFSEFRHHSVKVFSE